MRTPRPLAAVLALALAFAGCLQAIDDRLRAADVEAPRWNVGDWWTYRVTSDAYGTDLEVNVTVAEVNGSIYELGHPEAEVPLEALLFHMPALGPVHEDLSWEVHGQRFQPVSWPLAEDKTWDTKWISGDVHLTAHLRENGTWLITNQGFEERAGGLTYNLTYDPAAKWFRSFTRTDMSGVVRQSVELVSHGSGARDPVRVHGPVEVAFLESRSQLALGAGGPSVPNPSFVHDDLNDTLLVGCIIGGAPGRYQAEVVDPANNVVCSRSDDVPTQDATYRLHVVEAAAVEGTWTTRLLAGGEGSAMAEVLAYTTRVVTPAP